MLPVVGSAIAAEPEFIDNQMTSKRQMPEFSEFTADSRHDFLPLRSFVMWHSHV
jgi:hypothetical protein